MPIDITYEEHVNVHQHPPKYSSDFLSTCNNEESVLLPCYNENSVISQQPRNEEIIDDTFVSSQYNCMCCIFNDDDTCGTYYRLDIVCGIIYCPLNCIPLTIFNIFCINMCKYNNGIPLSFCNNEFHYNDKEICYCLNDVSPLIKYPWSLSTQCTYICATCFLMSSACCVMLGNCCNFLGDVCDSFSNIVD